MLLRLSILALAAVSLMALSGGVNNVEAGSRPTPHTIALEGDAAPGSSATMARCELPADKFTFDEPMTNAAGDVVFWSCLSDGGGALYYQPFGGETTLLVRGGQTLPGIGTLPLPSADGTNMDGPAINNRGTVIFAVATGITGTGAPTGALFMKTLFNDVKAVVRQGDSSPCGGTFVKFDDMSLNNKDDIAFIASYNDGSAKAGVFLRMAGGALSSILCNGDSLPGTGTPNEKFVGVDFGVDGPWINDGDVVIMQPDSLTGPQVTDPVTSKMESKWAGSVWAKRPGQPIESFIMVGDEIPAAVGGGVIHGLGIGRPGFNNDGVLGFNLARETFTPEHPAEQFIASKKLGSPDPISICAEDLKAAPGGTFEGFGAVTVNQKGDLAFNAEIDTNPNAEDPNNPEADNTRGVFTCKAGQLTTVLLQTDQLKPRAQRWSHELEETSSNGPFVVLMDEVNYTGPTTDRGVFLIGSQEDPIQGNFKCADGHVNDLDILQLLKFKAGIQDTPQTAPCPTLGQAEPRTGFDWGDVNCDGSIDLNDVTFMLANRAGVPRAAATQTCHPIGEVITS